MKGVPPIQRTFTECWRFAGAKWLELWEDWQKTNVFSHTRQTYQDALPLPEAWDNKGFDMSGLGMVESNRKKIVFVDSCNSAAYEDMARAFGMFSLQGASSNDQIYIGWKLQDETPGNKSHVFRANTRDAAGMFWQEMGKGKDVYDSFHAIYTDGTGGMNGALWGENGSMDLGSPTSDDGVAIYGRPGGLDNTLQQ
jgi:hypothetical protein